MPKPRPMMSVTTSNEIKLCAMNAKNNATLPRKRLFKNWLKSLSDWTGCKERYRLAMVCERAKVDRMLPTWVEVRLRSVPVIGMIRSNTKRMAWMVAPIKIAKKTGRVTQTFLTLPSNEIDAGELLDDSEWVVLAEAYKSPSKLTARQQ